MKRILVATAVSAALFHNFSLATPFGDARALGMGNVGVASGDFTRAAANPALLTRFQDNDDAQIQLGVGALGRNYEDVIDGVDEIQDSLDDFDDALMNLDPTGAEAAKDQVLMELANIDNDMPEARLGVILGLFVPSNTLGWGLYVNSYGAAAGLVDYVETDEQVLDDAIASGVYDEEELDSNVDVNAVLVTEVALPIAHRFPGAEQGDGWSLGLTPKLQRLDSYYYNATVATFDEDEITSNDNMTDDTGFNLDVGLQGTHGMFNWGLVARDLLGNEVDSLTGQSIKLEPTLVLGAAIQGQGFTLGLDIDAIENKSFDAFLPSRQMARIGLEYNAFGHAQVRLGYRHDFKDNYGDLFSAGLGLSPWDVISLDLAATAGRDDELGANLQLGIKI